MRTTRSTFVISFEVTLSRARAKRFETTLQKVEAMCFGSMISRVVMLVPFFSFAQGISSDYENMARARAEAQGVNP